MHGIPSLKINAKNFRPFGRVIEYPRKAKAKKGENLFRIVVRERRPFGWRIAYLVVRERVLKRMEQHLETFESFEPVRGRSLIYVADRKEAGRIRCFRLDVPVVLHKGIWHGVVTLDGEAEIKISENAKVKCLYWRLNSPLR